MTNMKLTDQITTILLENLLENDSKSPIVIYPGRFQPFHAGHYKVYKLLVDTFGKDNVYITTSDKIEPDKSPLSFIDKQTIMSKMFGIDPDHIIQTKMPYVPKELLATVDQGRPAIFAVGDKDSDRLTGGKYFRPYDPENANTPFRDAGYVFRVPTVTDIDVGGQPISGTAIRQVFGTQNDDAKKALFTKLYGKFDQDVFDILNTKLSSQQQITEPSSQVHTTDVPPQRQSKPTADQFLKYKIKNPETGNDIFVGSALKYDDGHPARVAAEKFIQTKLQESIILESGAYGHMSHPYEDMSLSFSDIKELVKRSLLGGLDKDGPVVEKTDGQNIMFSVKYGKILFARNKGHIKNFGANAMDGDQLCQKFSGRGSVESSFCNAGEDLKSALSMLTPEQITRMFDNGQKFMSAEIINPDTQNVIPYNKSVIIFHGTVKFDYEGTPLLYNMEEGEDLSTALQSANAIKQKTYGLHGQRFISFSDFENDKYKKKVDEYVAQLDEIQRQVGTSDSDTLGMFLSRKWISELEKYNLPDEEVVGLIRRWVYGDKSFGVKNMNSDRKQWFREMDKSAAEMNSKFIKPIKILVLKLGADSISRITDTLAANNPQAAEQMIDAVQQAIASIKQSNDPNKLSKLEQNLDLLNSIGMEKISSTEGLVFNYGDRIYKLTGAFAPVNQIIGMIKYGSSQEPSTESPEPSGDTTAAPVSASATEEPVKIKKQRRAMDLNKKIVNPLTKNNIQLRTALNYPEDHPARKLANQVLRKD